MYQIFREMIADIFADDSFTEPCYVNGIQYKCICSSISDDVAYTAAGLQSEVNFTLDLELAALHDVPKEGDKIFFREKQYKISSTSVDSANASIKLYLVALSKGA